MQPLDQPRRYRFGPFDIDLNEGELRRLGVRVKLNDKPFQVLCVLLERAGTLVTREDLRQRLWSADTYVDFDANLNTALSTLRHTLGDSSENPLFIETVPRQGYRFIAPVTAASQAAVGNAAYPASPGPAPPPPVIIPHTAARRQVPWFPAILAFLMFLGFAAAVGWTLYTNSTRTPLHQGKLVILVTPFENLSGDPAQEFLSDGLTDEMITRLGQISPSRVSVMARSTAMQYKHTHKSVEQITRECRLDYVLEGSLRRQENRIRVTVQLFRAGERGSLWTEAYEQDASNLLTIQQDVAERIAHSLSLEVLPVSAGPMPANQPVRSEITDHAFN